MQLLFARHAALFSGLACFLLPSFVAVGSGGSTVAIEPKLIDLRQADFTNKGVSFLNGDWHFYWSALYPSGQIPTSAVPEKLTVPNSWHTKGWPAVGNATYRVRVLLPQNEHNLALFFPVVHSACQVWVNGKLAYELGRVSKDANSYVPRLASIYVPIPDDTDVLDLQVLVSNHSYFNSGIVRTPIIGKSPSVLAIMTNKSGLMGFLIGVLIAMFLFQLMLFTYAQLERAYLWLAFICLCVAMRSALTSGGSFFLPGLFPELSSDWWRKLEFMSVYATSFLVPLYVFDVFPARAPRWPIYIFVPLGIFLCGSVLLTDQLLYGQLLSVYHVSILAGFVYMFGVTIRAIRDKRGEATLVLIGLIVAFPFVLIEVLYTAHAIQLPFSYSLLVETAVGSFLFFQMTLLARRILLSNKALHQLNVSLESQIKSRTTQLEKLNKVKDRLLSVISHDLKSPLHSLRGLLTLFHQNHISENELKELTREVEAELSRTTLLMENLLSSSANQLKGYAVKMSKFDLYAMLNEVVDLYGTSIKKKNLVIQKNLNSPLWIVSDSDVMKTVIRNILGNAIKFSNPDGLIQIQVNLLTESVSIEIKDFGTGMDQATLNSILKKDGVLSRNGTANEKGTGLGLMLVDDYVNRIGGRLSVQSKLGEGSEFQILVPARFQ